VEDHGVTPRTCSLSLYSEDERGEKKREGGRRGMGWRWVGLPARAGAAEEEKGDGPEKKREAQGGERGFYF
jgi:hypothetical protein